MKELKCKVLRENVQLPAKAHKTDAGIDLFFNPEDGQAVSINPSESHVLGTGISCEIPEGMVGLVCNRSSVASKLGLVVGAHVCDAGYSGEIFINLINTSKLERIIEPKTKIAQILFLTIGTPSEINVVDEIYEDKDYALRGEKGFGSSGA